MRRPFAIKTASAVDNIFYLVNRYGGSQLPEVAVLLNILLFNRDVDGNFDPDSDWFNVKTTFGPNSDWYSNVADDSL